MTLSNSQRQERWLEKNRALHNLRRRQKRKNNLPVPLLAESLSPIRAAKAELSEVRGEARESNQTSADGYTASASDSRGRQSSSSNPILAKLQQQIAVDLSKPVEQPLEPAKQVIYRDDFGNILPEAKYREWMARKETASQKGYVIDEFSQ